MVVYHIIISGSKLVIKWPANWLVNRGVYGTDTKQVDSDHHNGAFGWQDRLMVASRLFDKAPLGC